MLTKKMLEAELGKNLKKSPVVEFQIPKRIFTIDQGEPSETTALLPRLWDFDGWDA
jgi:U3 small nucleolar RNA-associated protein 19